MVTGIAISVLTKLAGISLKRPKLVMAILASLVLVGFGVHYKMLVGERDKLKVATAGYEAAVVQFEAREASLQADLAIAQFAASQALPDRREARERLETFRRSRKSDAEAQAWAEQLLPIGEIQRLCTALPDMAGC